MDYGELLTGIIRTLGLTALVLLGYSVVIRRFPKGLLKGTAIGTLFAVAGIVSMHDPIVVAPGIFLDGRVSLLAIAYPYAGPIGAIVATIIMALYRLGLGGMGVIPGVITIVLASLVGYLFTFIPVRKLPVGATRSIVLGLAASVSLVSIFLLPGEIRTALLGFPICAIIIGNVVNVVVLIAFIEREKSRLRLLRTLEHEAWVDPLTQLQNRRAFDKAALIAMNDNRSRATACSLIMIDIDHFKMINDRLGHDAGDLVLAKVAAIIRKNVRASDIVVRYAGEEIALLLINTAQVTAFELAEKVRKQIAETEFGTGNETITVTVSAGVASLSERHVTIDAVMKAADKALYSAKSGGRNRVEAA